MEIERKLTEWMNIMNEWGENVGVCESECKTVTLKSMAADEWETNLYEECEKYLDIRVSEKMYFKVHFERIRVKVTNVMQQMRRVLKIEWGMRKRAVKMV